jgi:hypothetical protein
LAVDFKPLPVWSKYSCGAGVVPEQSSETLAAHNGVAAESRFRASRREEQLVALALMVSFGVIMRAELS